MEDRAGPSKDLATVAGSHPKKCWRGHLSIHTRLPVSPAPLTFSTQLLTYIVLLQSLLTPHSDCCGLSPLLSSSPLTYRCKTLTPLPNSWPPSPAPWDPRGRDDLAFCNCPAEPTPPALGNLTNATLKANVASPISGNKSNFTNFVSL